MTLRETLPSRRDEAWKYSDLRAALRDAPLPDVAAEHGHVIARLAPRIEAIVIASGERRVLAERFDADGLDARAAEIVIEPNGALTRLVLQTGGGVPLSHARVKLGAGARFSQIVLMEGARLARIETLVEIEGEGAEVRLNGLYLVDQGRHADLTSRVEHRVPHGRTTQLIKGAARSGGRGVFQGKIFVARGAQTTDARQNHHALLLEEGAEIYAKPELEIYADDVQCAHGNTAGSLDDDALFYMRARGLPEAEARALLIEAFLLEAVPEDAPAEIAEEIKQRIARWLKGGAS